MPESVRVEEVTIENHYMDRELWVSIEPKEMDGLAEFYEEKNRLCLQFKLTDVYEYHSIFEDNTLYVEFVAPKEVYDKIIVIDPAYGMEETGVTVDGIKAKDITLKVAKALKEKLDGTDGSGDQGGYADTHRSRERTKFQAVWDRDSL